MTCFTFLSSPLLAISNQFNYQGILKENDVPVTGARAMEFQIWDSATGGTMLWTSGSETVNVTEGVFSVQIGPASGGWPFDWSNSTLTPYLQTLENGQPLQPREALVSVPFALACNNSGNSPVPSGMIAIFNQACPAGWTRFTALDNAFPMGSDTYGNTGGSATHAHSISTDGSHNHAVPIANNGSADGIANHTDLPFGQRSQPGGLTYNTLGNTQSFSSGVELAQTSTDGAHNHGGQTGSASSLPPYVTVVWCMKN